MITLNNVLVLDTYDPTTTLGPVPTCEKIVYLVANQSVVAQVVPHDYAATQGQFATQPEILVSPQSAEFQRCQGVRFRNAVAGKAARVIAQLIEPADIVPIGGTPFSGVLSASGGVNIAVPGTELAYQEFSAQVNVPGTVVTAPTVTVDGATPILVEFFAPFGFGNNGAQGNVWVHLNDGGTDLGIIAQSGLQIWGSGNVEPASPIYAKRKLTPASGTHTYSISVSNVGAVVAGAGGAGVTMPGYIRVTNA